MRTAKLFVTGLYWFGAFSVGFECLGASKKAEPDPRNFANGRLIPAENYCDQPRIVVTKDGTWVCVLTTGTGNEGEPGQHVVAASSTDQGKTWSRLVSVEPPDREKRSAYALALVTPADRIYAFYCYNGDAIRTKPDGDKIRDDMQGWCCYRYSDNKGKTWSKRYRIPMRLTAADRGNMWEGRLQMFWAIGTPTIFNGSVMFAFTKLGEYILQDGEGWFYRSDNVLTERNPKKIKWQLLPDGDHGVRTPEFGSVQEEFDVVHLENNDFFAVYRTTLGFAASSYSRDGGHTWSKPSPLSYSPGGRIVKQPRACTKIWKTSNGRYVLWFHNNGTTTFNNGMNSGSRNIAWLSGGKLEDGFVHWSQPEIVAYVEGQLEGCSYPDLVEQSNRFYVCATQKTQARVMDVEKGLLDALWNQQSSSNVATNGLALDWPGKKHPPLAKVKAPHIAPLCGEFQRRKTQDDSAGNFTIDVAVKFADLTPDQTILDTRDTAGRGYLLRTGERGMIRFEMSDGWQSAYWDSDAGLLDTNTLHHIVTIVDGRPEVICFVVDGVLCDGGAERLFGFGRFNPTFKDISGRRKLPAPTSLHGELKHLRIYDRAIHISEAVGNFHALTAKPTAKSAVAKKVKS